jgi:uncharacterized protein (DUF58 family)
VAASTPERLLQRLDWQVVRKLDGLLQGDYRTLLYGFGVDLADLREYQPGDDIRYIDWNVTARLGVPHVRQYLEDREITAWFLVDLSPSLDFGSTGAGKRESAIELVTTLARLLTRHGNRVGAIVYGSGIESVVPAGSGRLQVLRIVNELTKARAVQTGQISDLSVLTGGASRFLKRRSLVVLVSDFVSVPGWEAQLSGLSRRHDVVAVCIHDPLETELPDVGVILLEDSETGEQLRIDTHDPGLRDRFREASQRRSALLRNEFRRIGVDALWLSTDDDLVRALARFADARAHRRVRH